MNPLTPERVDRLADVGNVVAIKESSNDFNNFYKTLVLAGDRIRVFPPGYVCGAVAMELGAAGYFQTFSNYWGPDSNGIYAAYLSGDEAKARRMLDLEIAAREVLSGQGRRNGYAAIKAAMNLFGRPGGYPRPPLRPIGEPDLSEIRDGLARLGHQPPAPIARVAE